MKGFDSMNPKVIDFSSFNTIKACSIVIRPIPLNVKVSIPDEDVQSFKLSSDEINKPWLSLPIGNALKLKRKTVYDRYLTLKILTESQGNITIKVNKSTITIKGSGRDISMEIDIINHNFLILEGTGLQQNTDITHQIYGTAKDIRSRSLVFDIIEDSLFSDTIAVTNEFSRLVDLDQFNLLLFAS